MIYILPPPVASLPIWVRADAAGSRPGCTSCRAAPLFTQHRFTRTILSRVCAARRYAHLSHGSFVFSLCLSSWFAWGGCVGNMRIFLPLFMCAGTVRFSRRNGSLIDFLHVGRRLPHNEYLRLTRKGDHHLLKHQPKHCFPREGKE